ncbi:MAG: amino acid ABC transporter permease [Proteobacteria bacterium]|jgi:amine acid ABC transporter, permease protein, 3-TM region, His/Glu/Gln/Arg/opine family|nr:MAG: amino acid ABC transporter permease [Pseudomonadota bacterium]
MAVTTPNQRASEQPSLLYRAEVRQVIYQVLLVVALVSIGWWLVHNVAENLRRQNIASGFDFLWRTSGFDISQSLIPYSNTSSYGRAFWVGLLNTLLVAGIGIIFATVLGFIIGIARLSTNWVIAKLAAVYVEVVRNLPLLLQLFFWYFAVLKNLPAPRQSIAVVGGGFLNVRGLYLPWPVPEPGFGAVTFAFAFGILASIGVSIWARRRQMQTGQQFPVFWSSVGLIIGLPLLTYLVTGMPLHWEYPVLRGFNFQGGMVVQPEFLALLLGLSFYTASFIAEIVRAGILGVPKGQKEAAKALGLTDRQMLRLVVIPQAARIIIPPLTSQYLNLTKNSSLAVAIGYPDFVSVFAGTVLNQTGQAVEIILMTMGVYLTISLLTSAFMNWFNRRMALVER